MMGGFSVGRMIKSGSKKAYRSAKRRLKDSKDANITDTESRMKRSLTDYFTFCRQMDKDYDETAGFLLVKWGLYAETMKHLPTQLLTSNRNSDVEGQQYWIDVHKEYHKQQVELNLGTLADIHKWVSAHKRVGLDVMEGWRKIIDGLQGRFEGIVAGICKDMKDKDYGELNTKLDMTKLSWGQGITRTDLSEDKIQLLIRRDIDIAYRLFKGQGQGQDLEQYITTLLNKPTWYSNSDKESVIDGLRILQSGDSAKIAETDRKKLEKDEEKNNEKAEHTHRRSIELINLINAQQQPQQQHQQPQQQQHQQPQGSLPGKTVERIKGVQAELTEIIKTLT